MLKLALLHTRCIHRLSELSLSRAASCGLRHQQRQNFRTQIAHCNREDDLPIGVESVSDPLKIQSATALWKKEELLSRINALLHCSADDLERLYQVNKKSLRTAPPKMITDNIRLLMERGVSERSILKYPKILSIRNGTIRLF